MVAGILLPNNSLKCRVFFTCKNEMVPSNGVQKILKPFIEFIKILILTGNKGFEWYTFFMELGKTIKIWDGGIEEG